MRKVKNIAAENIIEVISHFSYQDSGIMRVSVVQGFDVAGFFQPLAGKGPQDFQIAYEDFDAMMADPDVTAAMETIKEKLWLAIDTSSEGKDAMTTREMARHRKL